MTIYYNLTFLLLAGEMITFCLLVAPMPQRAKKAVFDFLLKNTLVAKVAYALKISFIFVFVLFVDAIQRMWKITAEADLAKQNVHTGTANAHTESTVAAKKFYAQRNTYLTGFCLFLSLVLTRVFYVLHESLEVQEENNKLKIEEQPRRTRMELLSSNALQQEKLIEELKAEVATLKGVVGVKERDFDTLKKQALSQAAEYNRLADRYNEATGSSRRRKGD